VARQQRGRPPLEDGDRSVPVHLKLCGREYDALYERAKRERVSVPEMVRREMRAQVEKQKT
jgi:hypothetical protein